MFAHDDSLDREVLAALKSVDLALAAKFASHRGMSDQQFDRQVVTGKDKFGRNVTTRFGDTLARQQFEKVAADAARDRCTRENINDPAKFKHYYEEALAKA